MSLLHKVNRYKNLINYFGNWVGFLLFKSGKSNAFQFNMRNGFQIQVPRKMLPPFKESFLDQVYLKNFPSTQFLEGNPTIMDIGGNVGYFSLFMFSQNSAAKVYSFEPMPFNFSQMRSYAETYPNFEWHIENKAIGPNNDPLVLYTSTVDEFSTMAGVFGDERRSKSIEVESKTISQVIDENHLGKIDLMKLDCEGSEYEIFKSMTENQIKAVSHYSIETHPGNNKEESHEFLLNFLKEHGYQAVDQMNADGTGYIWAWI